MPMGYTSYILEGASFKDFALKCARNFGILIEMRDEDWDAEVKETITVEPKYYEKVIDLEKEIEDFKALTLEECEAKIKEQYDDEVKRIQERLNELKSDKKKYEDMYAKVENWEIPNDASREFCLNLKEFMKNQIINSIEYDCSDKIIEYYENYQTTKIADVAKWKADSIVMISECLDNAKESLKTREQFVKTRNEYLGHFMKSIENVK